MARKRREGNAFDSIGEADTSTEAFAGAMYSAPPSTSGRITAKPIEIFSIVPDFRQPRKAIPLGVMNRWDRDVSTLPALLARWESMAVEAYQGVLSAEARKGFVWDLPALLTGVGDALPDAGDDVPAVWRNFMALVSLAASIKAEGLTNPITVSERDGGYLLETGERRWLAHHLLHVNGFEEFGRVPCRVVEHSVWRQASENNTREPLNAVGMARQIALLIMDMYGDAHPFESYEALVPPGGCDRAFYAQVANGYKFRVLDAKRMEDATGLSSKRFSHYRKLLEIYSGDDVPDGVDADALNDELWMLADFEDWSEFAIRTEYERVKKDWSSTGVELTPFDEDGADIDSLDGEQVNPPPSPSHSFLVEGERKRVKLEDWVKLSDGFEGRVIGINGDTIQVAPRGHSSGRWSNLANVVAIGSKFASPNEAPSSIQASRFVVGSRVSHPHYGAGVVERINGDAFHVRFDVDGNVLAMSDGALSAVSPPARPVTPRGEGDFDDQSLPHWMRNERDKGKYDESAKAYQRDLDDAAARRAMDRAPKGAKVLDYGSDKALVIAHWGKVAVTMGLTSVADTLRAFYQLEIDEAERLVARGEWEAYMTSVDGAVVRLLRAMDERRGEWLGELFSRFEE